MGEKLVINGSISPVLDKEGRLIGINIEGHAPFVELQSLYRGHLQSGVPLEIALFYSGSDPVTVTPENFEKVRDLFYCGENPNTIVNTLSDLTQKARRTIIRTIPSEQQSALQTNA